MYKSYLIIHKMKKVTTIKRWKWSILFVIIVFIIIVLFAFDNIKIETFLASLGVTITAYLGILRQKIDDDKVFRELFNSFNQRYSDQINDEFNKLMIPSESLEPPNKLLIIDYFNLCSEEFLWYKKGRIPNDIWKAWEAGIIFNLSIPQVKELFECETKDKGQKLSYYGFAEYITSRLK